MPAQFTLPPDNRAVGTGNPPADMNALIDTVTAMGAAGNVLNAAYAGGADPTGAADSTSAIQAAINALPATGGTVYLPAGTYKVASTLTVNSLLYACIRGAGRWATKINFTGTGDCLRVYDTDTTGRLTGGGLLDFTIDGTSAGNSSAGLHYGDMRAGELRIAVQNFTGTGSIGVHLDNQNSWTEECFGYLWVSNNTQNVVFDVSGATTAGASFGYSDFSMEILAKANQDGVVLANGALIYNSRLSVKGNFQGTSAANTSAVLRLTGTVPAGHPNAGNGSKLLKSRLDILAECASGTGSNVPQTIAFGTLGTNTLIGCTGILDFSMGNLAFATTNWTALGAAGSFMFTGLIAGDFNLNNAGGGITGGNSVALQGAVSFSKSLLNVTNGAVSVDAGDFFNATLTGNTTISLNPGGASTLAGAQRKTIIIRQAAAGGPFTVTWPSTGSPTTSSPTIIWPGGVTPAMSTAASAADVYFLDTYDGATWYGRAMQASDQFPAPVLAAAPAGATAETFSRGGATSICAALASGTLYVRIIPMQLGTVVNNITFITSSTAKTGGTHGWYVLLDKNLKVVAVTADQTDPATVWGTISTYYTLPVTAQYTATYTGLYYAGVMVAETAGTMPTFAGAPGVLSGVAGAAPVLCGSSSTAQTTPPAVGATMSAVSSSGNYQFYAYTS
jgi:hypothetical protein